MWEKATMFMTEQVFATLVPFYQRIYYQELFLITKKANNGS